MGNVRFLKTLSIAYDLDSRTRSENCSIVFIPYVSNHTGRNNCFKGIDKENPISKRIWEENLRNGVFPELKPLRWAFTESFLEDVTDEGIIRVENPKTKRQVAVQIENLVVINKTEFHLMDAESKDALFVHEAVLYAIKKLNPELIKQKGTAPLRAYVNALVSFFKNPSEFPSSAVREAFEQLMIEDRFILW